MLLLCPSNKIKGALDAWIDPLDVQFQKLEIQNACIWTIQSIQYKHIIQCCAGIAIHNKRWIRIHAGCIINGSISPCMSRRLHAVPLLRGFQSMREQHARKETNASAGLIDRSITSSCCCCRAFMMSRSDFRSEERAGPGGPRRPVSPASASRGRRFKEDQACLPALPR